MSLAIAEALGPLAGLGGQVVAPADMARLLGDARRAVESASLAALRQLLAEAEAMPVLTNGAEPPGNAVIVADVLACLVYAMKTMVEPDPALWSRAASSAPAEPRWLMSHSSRSSAMPAALPWPPRRTTWSA
jgi:hypothetical protein